MFTVLIRYKKTGREVLRTAETVEFISEEGDRQRGLLINSGIDAKSGFHLPMTTEADKDDYRDVFIMNNDGQTVARYVL